MDFFKKLKAFFTFDEDGSIVVIASMPLWAPILFCSVAGLLFGSHGVPTPRWVFACFAVFIICFIIFIGKVSHEEHKSAN
jgi:hypothetical protein